MDLTNGTTPFERKYTLFGVAIQVRTSQARVVEALGRFFGQFPGNESEPTATIKFDLCASESFGQAPSIPLSAKLVSSPKDTLRAFKTRNRLYFLLNGSWLTMSLPDLEITGALDCTTLSRYSDIHSLFLTILCVLLHYCGVHMLHAAGLEHAGKGYLLVGESQSGKSTAAISLVREGWHYLGDDLLFVQKVGSQVQALAVHNEFKVDEQVICRLIPEATNDLTFKLPECDKLILKMCRLFPGQVEVSCVPHFLLFPEIVPQATSELVTMQRSDAVKRIIVSSPLLFLDSRPAAKHLEVLAGLVRQVKSFRLLAGSDVIENHKCFEKILLSKCQ